MSASKHMVRVLRNDDLADELAHPSRSTRARTVLLASLTLVVTCAVVASLAPQFPHILALLQGHTSLGQYFGG